MSTAAQIFSFARAVLQTDDTDLTDEMLFAFSNDATDRILNLRNNWPHLYSEGTLAMVAGDNQYALASASFNPQTFDAIEAIWDDDSFGTALSQQEYQEMAGIFLGPNQTTSDRPLWFTVYGGNVYLYPMPSGTRSLRVSGYRVPVEMEFSTDSPDIPTKFHNAIKFGTVALSIAQSEDYEGSQFWATMANQSAASALSAHFNNLTNRPIQMHGRTRINRYTYPDWVRTLVP